MTTFPTSLGTSSADEIRLLGHDLTADLMGQVGFGELAFWLVAMRRPTPSETRVFEAVLVALPETEEQWDAVALAAVRRTKEAGRYVPGLGHPVHKDGDPRTPVLIGIAEHEGLRGPHLRLFEAVGRVHEQVLGRRLPLNGAGVCGAALADLGLPVEMLRGFALLARAAGLLGQLAEERRRPIGMDVYLAVDRNAQYVDPQS